MIIQDPHKTDEYPKKYGDQGIKGQAVHIRSAGMDDFKDKFLHVAVCVVQSLENKSAGAGGKKDPWTIWRNSAYP